MKMLKKGQNNFKMQGKSAALISRLESREINNVVAIDFRAFGGRDVELIHDLDGLTDEHGAVFRIKWTVRGKDKFVHAKKIETAL